MPRCPRLKLTAPSPFSKHGLVYVSSGYPGDSPRPVYAALGRTLTVFDLTNPAAPRKVGAHTVPDKIGGVTEAGGMVYAAVDKYGLAFIDASGPAGLALRGSFKTPGQAKSVALVGTTALVADQCPAVQSRSEGICEPEDRDARGHDRRRP
jgi:hypothetical protein